MLLRHWELDWPEATGQNVICPCCTAGASVTTFISVWWTQNPGTDTEGPKLACQLVCLSCVIKQSHPLGRA